MSGITPPLLWTPITGYPCISYMDYTNRDLKYTAYDGSTWHIETVDSEGYVGDSTSLALDPTTGYPRNSSQDSSNYNFLKYADLRWINVAY